MSDIQQKRRRFRFGLRGLFGDKDVDSISLYPGTYDETHLAYPRDLFPEATISVYDGSD